RVKVYDENGVPRRAGMGIFPREVLRRFPLLPLEEEGRLHDMHLRENFIDRIFAYYRWTRLLGEEPTPGALVRFHTAHKLTLMAHSPSHYQEMGRLVAEAGTAPWEDLTETYGRSLTDGLQVMTTSGKHANVLQHLMGFLKEKLAREDKAELLGLTEDYRKGFVPLIVPLTLLKHHLSRHEVPDWVHQQVYLYPYPKELMLRNHV
ncbi:MAG: YbgA family protein, partial [Planctomycetota bacterium]